MTYSRKIVDTDLQAGETVSFRFTMPKRQRVTGYLLQSAVTAEITLRQNNGALPVARKVQFSGTAGYTIDGIPTARQKGFQPLSVEGTADLLTGTITALQAGNVKLFLQLEE